MFHVTELKSEKIDFKPTRLLHFEPENHQVVWNITLKPCRDNRNRRSLKVSVCSRTWVAGPACAGEAVFCLARASDQTLLPGTAGQTRQHTSQPSFSIPQQVLFHLREGAFHRLPDFSLAWVNERSWFFINRCHCLLKFTFSGKIIIFIFSPDKTGKWIIMKHFHRLTILISVMAPFTFKHVFNKKSSSYRLF